MEAGQTETSAPQNMSHLEELDSYLKDKNNSNNVLEFWCQSTQWFRLREVAYFLFAIPVRSVSSERVGSSLNLTLQSRRASPDPNKVDAMLYIKSNIDLISAKGH